ncbi:phage integrase N-terminal SAM-like domain-containing protein [Panacagrimonas sp.]|uniref:phage integrase N-terminal SAM-like domain-containing protein n=1 Tax=Panacagrimonas sp. TaxID=2480088 RepID=UPI003B51C55A
MNGADIKAPRLLDQVRDRLRTRHYRLRAERTYVDGIRRLILLRDKRHPRDLGGPEAGRFLTHLATDRNFAVSVEPSAGDSALPFPGGSATGRELDAGRNAGSASRAPGGTARRCCQVGVAAGVAKLLCHASA